MTSELQKLLVVESNDALSRSIVQVLKGAGYEVSLTTAME